MHVTAIGLIIKDRDKGGEIIHYVLERDIHVDDVSSNVRIDIAQDEYDMVILVPSLRLPTFEQCYGKTIDSAWIPIPRG